MLDGAIHRKQQAGQQSNVKQSANRNQIKKKEDGAPRLQSNVPLVFRWEAFCFVQLALT
jgi:hypothetical protein